MFQDGMILLAIFRENSVCKNEIFLLQMSR